jgi:hypothetical protein
MGKGVRPYKIYNVSFRGLKIADLQVEKIPTMKWKITFGMCEPSCQRETAHSRKEELIVQIEMTGSIMR